MEHQIEPGIIVQNIFNAPQTTIYYVIKTNFETYDGDIVTFYTGK